MLGISPQTWVRVLVITGLFAWLFWHNLLRLWLRTNPFFGEPNWGHAVCVPIIGLYYLFIHREDLIKAHSREFIFGRLLRPGRLVTSLGMIAAGVGIYFLVKDRSGIAIAMVYAMGIATAALGVLVLLLDWSIATLLFGLAVFAYAIKFGRDDYLSDLAMVVTLFGIVLLLCGWDVMKIAWFPIAFLVVALPWPVLVYSWVAEPLSQMAAHVAVHVLNITGVDSLCRGTKIIIHNADWTKPDRVLNVAEACAGMRSLMTFIAVAAAVAFLSARPLWEKLIIVVSAVPIAIFCNVMRISGQGLLDHYVSPELSESFAHQFVGMVMLVPAFFLLLLVGYMLDKMFIEEADEHAMNRPVVPRPVAAIPARREVIPAARTMSSVARPSAIAPAPVVNRVQPAPLKRTVAPSTPATRSVQPRPAAVTPPRPVTAANPRPRPVPPRAPSVPVPGRTATTPAPVIGPRSPVNPVAARPPQAGPINRPGTGGSAAKPAGAKPKEAP